MLEESFTINYRDYYDSYMNLITALRAGIVYIEFLKVDHSVRKMWGTRNLRLINMYGGRLPSSVHSEEERLKEDLDKGIVRVFCLHKRDWRSFRMDRVLKIRFVSSDPNYKIPENPTAL